MLDELREERPDDMSLRPRPGETAQDVVERVTRAARTAVKR